MVDSPLRIDAAEARQACREFARCAEDIIRASGAIEDSVSNAEGAFGRLRQSLVDLRAPLGESGLVDVGAGIVNDLRLALDQPAVQNELLSRAMTLQDSLNQVLEQAAKGGGAGFEELLTSLSEQLETFGPALSLLDPRARAVVVALEAGIPVARLLAAKFRNLTEEGISAEQAFENFLRFNAEIPGLRENLANAKGARADVIRQELEKRIKQADAGPSARGEAGAGQVLARFNRVSSDLSKFPPRDLTEDSLSRDVLVQEFRRTFGLLERIVQESNDPSTAEGIRKNIQTLFEGSRGVVDKRLLLGRPSELLPERPGPAVPSRFLQRTSLESESEVDSQVVLYSRLASQIAMTTEANLLNADSLATVRDRMAELSPPLDAAVQSAVAWREESLAGLDETKAGYQDFARVVDETFNGMVVRSLEDSLPLLGEFSDGARRAFESYATSATNAGAQVEGIIGGSLMNMENALVQFVQTDQLNFRALVDSLIADLIRLTIRAAILGPLARALGAAFGNGLGPQFTGTGFEGLLSSGSFAGGGSFVVGGGGGSDSRLVAFRATPGERVDILTPRQQETASPGGAVVNVSVINQAGAEVETRERPNGRGGVDLELLITRAVARDITRGGPVARSVLGLTGTGPALIGR